MGFGALAYDPMTGLAIDAEPDPAAPVALTPQGALSKAINRLAGTQFGEPRLQLWPEKLVRSAVTLPGDVVNGEQPMLPAGLRREDYTDAAPAARGTAEGIFGNTLFTPQPWQPNDPAYERAQDTAGLAGGGMMFGRLGAEATLGSGPVMRRHSMIENADQLKELANQRRARGEATGKSAPGWDFKRPEAPKGSWEDTVARTKTQWETDKSRALAGFEDVVPPKNPSPYLTPDDHAFLASGQFLSDSAAPGAPLAALERAAQQGYNIDAFHGTAAPPFEAFKRKPNDIGIHFGTADQANDRISYMAERGRDGEQHVYPVKLKINNPLRVEDLGGWGSENLFYGLGNLRDKAGNPLFDKEELRRAAFSAGNEAGRTKAVRDLIERKGYDGIVYKNTGETGGSEPYREALSAARAKLEEAFPDTFGGDKHVFSFTPEEQQHPAYQAWRRADDSYDRHRKENAQDSYIAFYPNQVRSKFAEFDPKNAKKGGLLLEDAATTGAPLAAAEAAVRAESPAGAYHALIDQPVGTPPAAAYHAMLDQPPAGAYTAPHGPEAAPAAREAAPAPRGDGPGGAGGGDARLHEAATAAARRAGAHQPLEGLPTKAMKIGDEYFVPGPIAKVRDVAAEYMANREAPSYHRPPTKYHPLDEDHAAAIARAFDKMPHAPDDPAVKASYDALIKETQAQYEAIKKTGLKIEPITPDMPDPYAANPRLAAKDVADNNHLWYFPTDQGFGSHAAMYSDLARPAMTTETRGQNSWVNYGPHGEANRKASAADTKYPDQKVGLMPEWTMRDRGSPEPIIAYHGTPYSFDKFDPAHIGAGEGNQAYGHGLYFAGHSPVSEFYRHQLSARRDPVLKKYGLDAEDGANVGMRLATTKGDPAPVIADLEGEIANLRKDGDTSKGTQNMIVRRRAMVNYLKDAERNPGHLYEVAIDHPPGNFLDWDTPLKEQRGPVTEAFDPQWSDRVLGPSAKGKDLYEWLIAGKAAGLESQRRGPRAARDLRENGIAGIRYLDQGSRGVPGKGTHNYVTFDAPRLLKRYAAPGLIGAGGFGSLAPSEDR